MSLSKGFSFDSINQKGSFIKRFETLQVLNVSHNNLTKISDKIYHLHSLKELYLGFNKLSSFPPKFFKLTQLQVIDIQSNSFSFFPNDLGALKSLNSLNFSNNTIVKHIIPEPGFFSLYELATVTQQSFRFQRKRSLTFNGDLKKTIKPDNCVIETGAHELVLETTQQRTQTLACNRSKLVILGKNGKFGAPFGKFLSQSKQQIVIDKKNGKKKEEYKKKLVRENFSYVTEDEEVKDKKDKVIEFSVWDFTDVDLQIYGNSLQHFFTGDSLYLALLDIGDFLEADNIINWIRYINKYCKKSPVFILLTNLHEYELEFCEKRVQQLKAHFSHLSFESPILTVGADPSTVIQSFKERLWKVAFKQSFVKEKINYELRLIDMELASKKNVSKVLSWKEWEEMFQKHYKKASMDTIHSGIRYFSTLSIIVPLEDNELIVLDVDWVVSAIEQFNDSTVKKLMSSNKGMLEFLGVFLIWPSFSESVVQL